MKECEFFEKGGERQKLKIYAILKRERCERSLLRRPQNFSWPPRQKKSAIFDSGAHREDSDKL